MWSTRKVFARRLREVNKIVESYCKYYNFIYIGNADILFDKHLKDDGLHLNPDGREMLTKKFVNAMQNIYSWNANYLGGENVIDTCSTSLSLLNKEFRGDFMNDTPIIGQNLKDTPNALFVKNGEIIATDNSNLVFFIRYIA